MKSLIVIPDYKEIRGDLHYAMPIGMAYVNAVLRGAGLDVECINLNHVKADDVYAVLADTVVEKNIDCVLCGGITPIWKSIKKVFDVCKKTKPSIITVGGGGHFTSEPIIGSEICEVDYAVIGEGEITNVELLLALRDGKDVRKVKGITYKTDEGYVQTEQREQILDLDNIPFPCYDGFDMETFLNSQRTCDTPRHVYEERQREMPMVLGRSCPYQCKFCFHPTGSRYIQRSFDNFFRELDQWMEMYKPTGIIIFDELFSRNVEKVYAFCERIKPYRIKWTVQLRVDIVNEDMIKAMKNAGCIQISYGLETYSPVVLNNMRKYISIDDINKALKITYDAGIDIQGNFIFGDEQETEETIYETLNFWFKHPEYRINLAMIETYPGCGYYKELMKNKNHDEKKRFIEESKWRINLTQMSDETYEKYETVIWKLQEHYKLLYPKYQKIYQNDNDEVIVELKCPHCGGHNVYYGVRKALLEFSFKAVMCSVCNHRTFFYTNKEMLSDCERFETLCEKLADANETYTFEAAVNELYEAELDNRDPDRHRRGALKKQITTEIVHNTERVLKRIEELVGGAEYSVYGLGMVGNALLEAMKRYGTHMPAYIMDNFINLGTYEGCIDIFKAASVPDNLNKEVPIIITPIAGLDEINENLDLNKFLGKRIFMKDIMPEMKLTE